jgi:hypothetical protein
MTLSMYQASIPVFVRTLENLAHVLAKGAAHAESAKLDPATLINAHLATDMYPLARQVQIASDAAKGCAARLAGIDVPSYADTETTFPELQARIAKTLNFIKSVDATKIDGSEDRAITLKVGGKELNFLGQPYLLGFVLPNLFFHVTIAYAILRHHGVPLGKMDFLGTMP